MRHTADSSNAEVPNGFHDWTAVLRTAEQIVVEASTVGLRYFRSALEIEYKDDESPVTRADRDVESAIRSAILASFPDHRVVGEEMGGDITGAGYEWIVDPIDGTKSFVRGVGIYTSLLALLWNGQPVLGIVYCPPSGEMVSAAVGCGARNESGRPVHVSDTKQLSRAWLALTDPSDFMRREPAWAAPLISTVEASRTWGDAYGYLLLARGDVDIMIDPIMSPWDIAPLGIIVREAGGVFSGTDGIENDLGTSALACGSPALHQAALDLRAQSRKEIG